MVKGAFTIITTIFVRSNLLSMRLIIICLVVFICPRAMAQTPVPMFYQPNLTYTENFDSIATWTDGFVSGAGANRFGSLLAQGTATIPDPTRITTATDVFRTGLSSGGIQKGTIQPTPTNSIVLLVTGTTNNSSATAIDFFMNFTGVDAGTISFDWNEVGNSTGNRTATFKLYASVDGSTFTELTGASVTVTNNVFTSGSITNLALPATFNNNANARLRLYYYNSNGGSTGSRPKFNIDNWKVTAVPNVACATPASQPSSLTFGTITDTTIAVNFANNGTNTDEYLVVASTSNSLTSMPVNGQVYNVGDNVGDGTVMYRGFNTNFIAKGLNQTTTYYFFIFALKSVCIGGPMYLTANPLTGNATTVAGYPPCILPASQPSNLIFPTIAINSISGSFTAAPSDEYLVLQSTSPTLSANPINGAIYYLNDSIGNAKVVQRSNNLSFTANGLQPITQYYFYVFSLNSVLCSVGPVYNLVSPLTANATTLPLPPCTTPISQATNLTFNASATAISGAFTPVVSADDYLVIRSLSPTLSSLPLDNTNYVIGDNLGGGIVVSNSSVTSYLTTGLTSGTTYYFYIFSANKNCSGGTKYLTTNPLTANIATLSGGANNVYFGTLHSHSDYSDGNQDNPGYTPAQNYNYAMSSQCMDFLGISEHNHYSSNNNPGTLLSNYHLGINQAASFNISNPNFVALYGMEWGVISNGGHVLVYGNGMDNLFGWETNAGGTLGNNYDVYVPQSTYTGATGLFKIINDNIATNTFASLAHPNFSDYNNIANIAYNASADTAISIAALESGPASSTNTSYSEPASSFNHIFYYLTMLSKGYHIGAAIDHDNHNTTFGRTTYSRTGVVAQSLSKTNIIKGYRNMNTYATQDCDIKVDFSINTKIMGSIFSDRYAPNIFAKLTDATTSLTNARIRLMYGVPGSGFWATKIDSAVGSTLSITDNNLANLATGYYYLDIINGSSRIVTSPIWYTRNDGTVVPVTFSSFSVQKQNNTVQLNWTTQQEVNSSHFIIQKSTDGKNWMDVDKIIATGNSSTPKNYQAFDLKPANGINYYRLKQVDKDGKTELSVVRSVSFKNTFKISVSPNPAKDFITVKKVMSSSRAYTLQIINENGFIVKQMQTNSAITVMDISNVSNGIYFIKVIDGESTTVQKCIKQ